MRTFLAFIGALAIGFVAAIIILAVIGAQRVKPILAEAHEYADDAIPAITTQWNGAELYSRATPELKELLANGALEQLMSAGSFQLGRLQDYAGATCVLSQYLMTTSDGETALVQCTGEATYQKAIAAFTLNLAKRKGEWGVLGFFVVAQEANDQPVMVAYEVRPSVANRSLGFSAENLSFGLSTSTPLQTGVDIYLAEKIRNDD